MESVKRFRFKGADYVYAADFDRVTAERDALQLLLNNRDDLDDQLTSLEQRRYAEQQAREAAERDAERYRWLRNGGESDTWLNNRLAAGRDNNDDPYHPYFEVMVGPELDAAIDAHLNHTAEAVSHDQ